MYLQKRQWRKGCIYALACLIMVLSMVSLTSQGAAKATARLENQQQSYAGGCPIFPADNAWNQDISALPVHPLSANYVASMGGAQSMHADFGAGLYNGAPIGIPYAVVPASQPGVPVQFDYAGESEPGPYPVPTTTAIEGGAQSSGDRHVLVIQSGTCKLYEMFSSYPQGTGWHAGSGAVWNLTTNDLRPQGWTSADAAGLPILPGLARYDEVASGAINHALRFTANATQKAFVWPARHFASSNSDPNLPPMGLRMRLKANIDISAYPPQTRIVLTALKRYGMILADNGSSWFVGGAPDDRWINDDLASLRSIKGSDFEAVDTSSMVINANSAQAHGAVAASTPVPATPTHSASPTKQAVQTANKTPSPLALRRRPGINITTDTTQTHSQAPAREKAADNPPVFLWVGLALAICTSAGGLVGIRLWRKYR
ncbi:hypothetical protein KDA_68630 [Dictyobacter alpinus]|uniref:Uncharacterized protein n=1 Tax=Dictyobacter alpinus TaxID=2014873 RepID=A0A402BJ62_9CHLR|nr:hypothetical protein [Dictyobacter alpinus]GCE31379.1 hypothetical protein KDA_68630 [Dictyobacter alpinus]